MTRPKDEVRITLPPHLKPITVEHPTRYGFDGVRVVPIDNKSAYIVATDGYGAAIVEAKGENLTSPQHVPRDILPGDLPCIAYLGKQWETADGRYAPACEGDQHSPPVADILPDKAALDETIKVTFSAELLWRLARVVGSLDDNYQITMFVQKNNSTNPMAIMGGAGVGVISPCQDCSDQQNHYSEQVEAYKAVNKKAGK